MDSVFERLVGQRNILMIYMLGLLITNSIAALIVFLFVGSGYLETLVINSCGTLIGMYLSLHPALKIYDMLIEARREAIEGYNTDALTGLMARKPLLDSIQDMLETDGMDCPIGIMLIDLDKFKNINDTYGHHAGDSVMAHVGSILSEHGTGDSLQGRFGGEEFLVCCPHQDEEWLIAYADRIRKSLDGRLEVDGQEIPYSASVGCLIDHTRIMTLNSLIKGADELLYLAKENGRNRTEYQVIRREAPDAG